MKNKEIEELLNKIKKSIKTHKKLNLDDDMLVVLEFDVIQWNLLLSYIEQLENKYDKALETLVDFNMPCERDEFNLLDTDYCELNCSNDEDQYKKCWDRWIEWRLEK